MNSFSLSVGMMALNIPSSDSSRLTLLNSSANERLSVWRAVVRLAADFCHTLVVSFLFSTVGLEAQTLHFLFVLLYLVDQ